MHAIISLIADTEKKCLLLIFCLSNVRSYKNLCAYSHKKVSCANAQILTMTRANNKPHVVKFYCN